MATRESQASARDHGVARRTETGPAMPMHDEALAMEHDDQPIAASVPSRRQFLGLGVAATAAATVGASFAATAVAEAQAPRGPKSFPNTPAGVPLDASADWKDPLLRLVRRITMGLSPEEVATARSMGYSRYLDAQLNASAIDDSAIDALVAQRLPMTTYTSTQLAAVDENEAEAQLQDAALYRAAFSRRQLKERMVEF
ncbi:MAG: DUF1800 family protein, partial [Gemmatimonas sp.]